MMRKAEHRQIMSYCTGGIRCEKGVRWMHENFEWQSGEKIYTSARWCRGLLGMDG